MHLVYNIRSILLFVALIQGLVIAALLVTRGFRKGRLEDHLMALFLFFTACSLIEHFIGFMGVYDYAREAGHDLTYFPFSNKFLPAPLIWLYTQALTDSKFGRQKQHRLHFIAPLGYYLLHFGVWSLPMPVKQAWFAGPSYMWVETAVDLLNYSLVFNYLYRSLQRYREYRRLLNAEYSNTDKLALTWLRNFLYGYSAYMAVDFLFSFTALFANLDYTDWYWLELLRAVLLYYVSVTGWAFAQKSTVPFDLLETRENALANQPSSGMVTDGDSGKTGAKVRFNAAETTEKCRQITEYMEQKQPWLDPELTLSELADQLNLNTSQLSWLANNGLGKNFNDFVNAYRVNAMIARMKNPEYGHLSLLGIAFECGFNSKATFNRAFKKETGQAPSAFFDAPRA